MSNKFINPSGFAENLPAEQLVEDRLKQNVAVIAESYGYGRLETASVEYMDTLASKGDVNKEIYTIGRAQTEGEGGEGDRGLHFDLTVPFARYVAQNQGGLHFPFRRYQIQKVWRGERPQKGRFREFYQADVDVVARDVLPIQFDAEVITVMARTLDSFGLGAITMHINSRTFLNGLFEALGIDGKDEVLQTIDKLDKIGKDEVVRILTEERGVALEAVENLFTVIGTPVAAAEVAAHLENIAYQGELLAQGIAELQAVFANLPATDSFENLQFMFNPSIARGLDYYTGTVVETTIAGLEKYGSICSGGRYANLAGRFTNQSLPGVGLSIGLTRLLSVMKEERLVDFSQQSKTDIVVCLLDEDARARSLKVAEELREAGMNVEQNQKPKLALGKQLDAVAERGIPYGLVAEENGSLTLYVVGGEKQSFKNLEKLLEFLG